jgi:hypothetical protein
MYISVVPGMFDTDLVNVLRLDDGLQVILQNLGEVVLQFGAPEVGQNLGPVYRTAKDSETVS